MVIFPVNVVHRILRDAEDILRYIGYGGEGGGGSCKGYIGYRGWEGGKIQGFDLTALNFFNPAFYNFSLCDDNFSPIHHNFSPSFLTCPVQNAFFTPPYKHHFGQCERA